MLKLFISFVCLIQFIGYSQPDTTNFSYYFKNNSAVYKQINGVDTRFFGKYTLKPNKHNEIRVAAGDYFIIDSSGIYIEKNNLISISKAEVRENGKYNVINGFLFGVINNDSIPVVLQDDKYFFLTPTKSFLFEKTHHFMYKVNTNSFLVFSKEDNGYYSLLKIDFNGSILSLSELELNYQQVKQIKSKFIIENGFDTYLLTPLKNQWQLIIDAFQVYDVYTKAV
jgi:hypothetical protein